MPRYDSGFEPDGREEHDVDDDETHRIDGTTGRGFDGNLSLDHQRQEIRENRSPYIPIVS